MRCLVITDIYANLQALEAVLADAKGLYDKVWCLGDLIAIGPYPNECVDLLLTLNPVCVAGDGDWIALGKSDPDLGDFENLDDFKKEYKHAFLETREKLTDKTRNYLSDLPVSLVEDNCTLVHASPRHPLREYVLAPIVAQPNFKHFQSRYCFHGHTNVPVIYQEPIEVDGKCEIFAPQIEASSVKYGQPFQFSQLRLMINPGGVGGSGTRYLAHDTSFYGIFDIEKQTFEFRKIPLNYNPFLDLRKRSVAYSVQKVSKSTEPSFAPPLLLEQYLEYNKSQDVVSSIEPNITIGTDIGLARKLQEDSVFSITSEIDKDRVLLIVVDGMGGFQAGEVSGKIVGQLFIDTFYQELKDLFQSTQPKKLSSVSSQLSQNIAEYLTKRLQSAVEKSNVVLHNYMEQKKQANPEFIGATCTFTCVLIQNDLAVVANVGDCRVYHLRDNKLRLITNNWPLQPEGRPIRTVTLRYGAPLGVGFEIQVNKCNPFDRIVPKPNELAFVHLYIWKLSLQARDRLLLCSDGLWAEVDESKIEEYLSQSTTTEEAVHRLIDVANAEGGNDNIGLAVYQSTANKKSS